MTSTPHRAALAVAALLVAATPAAAFPLAPHRAVYDLGLAAGASAGEGGGQSAMQGRMVFEFTGDACEGYTVNFRFVVETTDVDFRTTVTDLRTSSFEGGDGDRFQFLSQTYTNQVLTSEVKGTASRDGGGVTVDLVKPAEKTEVIGGGPIFPTDHLRRILEAAEDGKTVVQYLVFDGSDNGDRAYRTTAIIGTERTASPAGEEAAIGDLRRWPVSVAYFDAAGSGDQTPEYAIGFDLWENGVSTDLTMDYGDFVLSGRLVEYERLPEQPCDPSAKP